MYKQQKISKLEPAYFLISCPRVTPSWLIAFSVRHTLLPIRLPSSASRYKLTTSSTFFGDSSKNSTRYERTPRDKKFGIYSAPDCSMVLECQNLNYFKLNFFINSSLNL